MTATSAHQILDALARDPAATRDRLRAEGDAEELIAALRAAPDARARKILADILGFRHERGAVDPLIACLADADSGVRASAADALAKIGDGRAGPALLARFELPDPDLGVRRTLLSALGAVHHAPAIPLLVRWLGNPDPSQRGAAAWSLGNLGAVDAMPALEEVLRDERIAYPRERMSEAIRLLRVAKETAQLPAPDPADLRGAMLTGRRLAGAKMMGADGAGLVADGVDATAADFTDAALEGSSWRRARLARASFRNARLARSSFDGADLSEAFLAGADLSGADLGAAHVERTVLDDDTMLRGALVGALQLASITVPSGTLRGWAAAAWLARRAVTEPPAVALQAYLLAQMNGDAVTDAARSALGLSTIRVNVLHALLAPIFDNPAHHGAEYERWLGAPLASLPINVPGSFAGSTRAWWELSAWPGLRLGVSTHPEGHAWDVRFEGGTAEPTPGAATYDSVRAGGVTMSDPDDWPPTREATGTYPDGRTYRMRFDFDLLQRAEPVR